jgi:hypothetical protein
VAGLGPGIVGPVEVAFGWDPLQYPFDVPAHSFIWSARGVEALSSSVASGDVSAGRHAVLAIGSNASPRQLTRKFSNERFADHASPDGSIPVLTAVAEGVDVVYGAHVAPYGAMPATLLDTPGAGARVFVTWLTPLQLDRMNVTEALGHAYQLRPIDNVRCHGEPVDGAFSYVTTQGACVLGGGPLGLASIEAPGSRWPRGSQQQAWDHLAVDMGCDVDGAALLHRVLGSSDWRTRVEAHLVSHRIAEVHEPWSHDAAGC